MLRIRIGKYRLKVFNLLIVLVVLYFIIYLLGTLFFMIPIFNKTYNYNYKKENYEIKTTTKFKNAWLKCNVKEIYEIKSDNKIVYNELKKDLISDGFKYSNGIFIRKTKSFGICKNEKEDYKKEHKSGYVNFKLKGKASTTIEYGENYTDDYVVAKINNKNKKNVEVNSKVNEKQIGKYIVSYKIKISEYYTQRLYRIVNIVDKEKPEIKLEGEDLSLEYGQRYRDPGYTATDNYDGDITNKVKVKNIVNIKKSGNYKVTYTVEDTSGNKTSVTRNVEVKEKTNKVVKEEPKIEVKEGITYIDGIIVVNKKYGLPEDYDPKVNNEALSHLKQMQADATAIGLSIPLVSGYRSYSTQKSLYNKYVKQDGEEKANTYSAKPGHSEHQTGLAFDIGSVDRSFANTDEAKWIEENAHLYGFIVRYPKDKTDITGYIYEPWHVRYLGKDIATKVKQSGLTLEEYLGIN